MYTHFFILYIAEFDALVAAGPANAVVPPALVAAEVADVVAPPALPLVAAPATESTGETAGKFGMSIYFTFFYLYIYPLPFSF